MNIVDFPFCSISTSENFDIQATRIDRRVGFFRGVSDTLLKLFPKIPLELATQLEVLGHNDCCDLLCGELLQSLSEIPAKGPSGRVTAKPDIRFLAGQMSG